MPVPLPQDLDIPGPSTQRQCCFGGGVRLALDKLTQTDSTRNAAAAESLSLPRPESPSSFRRTDPSVRSQRPLSQPRSPPRLPPPYPVRGPPTTLHAKSISPAPRHGPLEVPVRLTEHGWTSQARRPGHATFDRRMRNCPDSTPNGCSQRWRRFPDPMWAIRGARVAKTDFCRTLSVCIREVQLGDVSRTSTPICAPAG